MRCGGWTVILGVAAMAPHCGITLTGYNPNYGVSGDAIQIKRLDYYYNIVGNVVGSTNQNPAAYTGCGGPESMS